MRLGNEGGSERARQRVELLRGRMDVHAVSQNGNLIANNSDNTAYVIGQIPLMTLQTKAKM